MASEIGNKGLLRKMAEALQILDPRQSPVRLDTEKVQAVWMLGGSATPNEQFSYSRSYPVSGMDIGGSNVKRQDITGVPGQGASTQVFFNNADYDCTLIGLYLQVTYLDAIADDQFQPLSVRINRHMNYGSVDPVTNILERKAIFIDGDQNSFHWNLGSHSAYIDDVGHSTNSKMPSLYIPRGDHVEVELTRKTGDWPTGTSIVISATILTHKQIFGQTAWDPGS